MQHTIISYGTLRSPTNVTALLGRKVGGRQGFLHGWRCYSFAGRPYPGITHDPHGSAAITAIGPLSATEIDLIDSWEAEYVRRPAIAVANDGTSVSGWLYVPRGSTDPGLAEAGVWSLASWEQTCLNASVQAAAAFRARYLSAQS